MGLKRLPDDQTLRDVGIKHEGVVWLMCKPPDVPDEDMILQDLAARPILRLALGPSETLMLGNYQNRRSQKYLSWLTAKGWSYQESLQAMEKFDYNYVMVG